MGTSVLWGSRQGGECPKEGNEDGKNSQTPPVSRETETTENTQHALQKGKRCHDYGAPASDQQDKDGRH